MKISKWKKRLTGTNRSNFLLNYFKSNSEFNEISCFAKGWNGIFKFGCKRKSFMSQNCTTCCIGIPKKKNDFFLSKANISSLKKDMVFDYSIHPAFNWSKILNDPLKMKYFWRKISKIFSFNYCLKKSRPLKALICLAIIAYTSLIDFCLIDTNQQSFPILSSLSLSSDVNWLLDGLN